MYLVKPIYNTCIQYLLVVAKRCVDLYLYFTKASDSMIKSGEIESNSFLTCNYIKYDVIKNNKYCKVIFMSETKSDIENDILDFKENIDVILQNKYLIVNCNLHFDKSNEELNEERMIDITDYIRYFCYYFDKDIHISFFLNYLQKEHLVDLSNYNRLTLYMNDFDFSEKTYNLSDVGHMKFKDIIKV